MPVRKVQFANDEFYHVVKRGVEQRNIFLDDDDRMRFLNSLFVFNSKEPALWNMRAFWHQRDPASLISKENKPEGPLVEIHAFALMDNHFHLLVKQLENNGISDFMNKLGGYSYYFNKKYERVGPLFQGRFRAILIKTDNQLKNAFVYVNTNPIGLIKPDWKEKGVKDPKRTVKFLENYKWSSYLDYLSGKNFSALLKTDFFTDLFGGSHGCKEEVESWIGHKVDVSKFEAVMLE